MESPRTQHLRVMFTRKMEERRLYMEELHESRMQNYKENFKAIKQSIGPSWYQVLSEKQQKILHTVKTCVYQDMLEGVPTRITKVLKALGIYPIPNAIDLLTCMFLAKEDPKQVFAQLFYLYYNHDFSQKRSYPYPFNGRMLLTSIYYLGLRDLIELLKKKFAPPAVIPESPPKPKPQPKYRDESPYLQYFTAVLYEPKKPKPKTPDPLPDLSSLNAAFHEEEVPVLRPPPTPPPPRIPKKRIPQELCEKMAGYIQIGPAVILNPEPPPKKPSIVKRLQASKMDFTEGKKVYGLSAAGVTKRKRKPRKPRLVEMANKSNNKYQISGIHFYGNKPYYIISNICTMPTFGDIMHGGHRLINGEYIRINIGIVDKPPPRASDPCDCLSKWTDKAIKYVNSTKCYCGHYYDYGNDGTFSADQPYYFKKPTKLGRGSFDVGAILELEPKVAHIKNEYQKIWDDESLLQDDDDDSETKKRKKDKKEREIVKVQSNCLGERPKVDEYLRCALRFFGRINIAARLPDIHKAPELREWMRKRIYGEYTREEKRRCLKKSRDYWQYMKSFQEMGLGKRWPEKNDFYHSLRDSSTWKHKMTLQAKFKKYVEDYKAKIFQTHAYYNNLLWATMYHPKFPDKRFRDIFFCYLVSKASDVTLIHPYNALETERRKREILDKRLLCLPKGSEDVDPGKFG